MKLRNFHPDIYFSFLHFDRIGTDPVIEEIARAYREEGFGDMPAAIIQHASLPQQKIVRGIAIDLPALTREHQLTYPSIIILGQVVAVNDLSGII